VRGVEGEGGRAEVVEEGDGLLVVLVRGPVERRVGVDVEQVDVCALLDEKEDEDGVVVLGGDDERRRALRGGARSVTAQAHWRGEEGGGEERDEGASRGRVGGERREERGERREERVRRP